MTSKGLVECASHRFSFVVEDIGPPYRSLADKFNFIMVKFYGAVRRAKRQKYSYITPPQCDETLQSPICDILVRYVGMRVYSQLLFTVKMEDTLLRSYNRKNVDSLLATLPKLEKFSKKLQKGELTKSRVKTLFGTVVGSCSNLQVCLSSDKKKSMQIV